jgi:Fe-Mn family superoxide dismutase
MISNLILILFHQAHSSSSCSSKVPYESETSYYPFELIDLPYNDTFLEPFISEDIVVAHHEHHHQTYVDKLNLYLDTKPDYQSLSLVELNEIAADDEQLQRHAGGIYNHDLYWFILTNPECAKEGPEGSLATQIVNQWGSVDSFYEEFNEKLGKIFGSGWGWACVNSTGLIEIRTTPNQVNTLMKFQGTGICYPFLGCDAWEHAYYLQYFWKRQEYYDAFFGAIDWDVVEMFYESYASNLEAVPF